MPRELVSKGYIFVIWGSAGNVRCKDELAGRRLESVGEADGERLTISLANKHEHRREVYLGVRKCSHRSVVVGGRVGRQTEGRKPSPLRQRLPLPFEKLVWVCRYQRCVVFSYRYTFFAARKKNKTKRVRV